MRDIFKIAGIYTAIILGAGFASGQEILTFFVRYGQKGFLGILLSGIIFSFVGYIVLEIAYIKKINSSAEFMQLLFGRASGTAQIINQIFLFILYFTMLSASGATLKQEFDMPYILGIIIMALLCIISYSMGTNFIAKINFAISPILFIGTIFVGLYAIIKHESMPVFFVQNQNWIKSALLYPAYNIITGVCVLVPIINTLRNKKYGKYGAVLGGIFMSILGLIIALAIFLNYEIIKQTQIPMLAIANKFSNSIKYIYLIVFMLAVFSTAIGNFFGLCENLEQKKIPQPKIFVSILAIIFANIEFSRLISKIYPAFGYIGLFEIIFIAAFYIFMQK